MTWKPRTTTKYICLYFKVKDKPQSNILTKLANCVFEHTSTVEKQIILREI